MNEFQRLWWQQARSDHEVFLLLRREGISACHLLHYLQMATEKLAKAYFWRTNAPPKSHAGFVKFLRSLGGTPTAHRSSMAKRFAFNRFEDFQRWIFAVLPIAYDLERITPALASDGPNSEYPWPHAKPANAPVSYEFDVWNSLAKHQGRELMRFVHRAVERFSEFA
ncbi:MAG TPA: hypothetical protein VMF30_09535 [Pirellulales bacterium]|nr:hypothetical protein [Pirellulales bacterium]